MLSTSVAEMENCKHSKCDEHHNKMKAGVGKAKAKEQHVEEWAQVLEIQRTSFKSQRATDFSYCVTVSKLLQLSELHSSHLQSGDEDHPP